VGTSNWQNISYCVGLLRRIRPSSLLDVGTGFGRWGVLSREFLDVWEGREARELWRARIEGIEAFEGCLTPVHAYVYDSVHVGDAVELLPGLGNYDVVYLGDVVEHQAKDRGWLLLDLACRHAERAAVVTIPIGEGWDQGMSDDGNPHHPHRSVWTLDDFDRYPDARREVFSDYLGRQYLVLEIPGGAVHVHDAASAAASPALPAAQSTGGHGTPGGHAAGPVLDEDLLARLDDRFSSLRLLDNPEIGIDAVGALLWQTPAASRIGRSLAALARSGAPASAALTDMVDALFRYAVGEVSAQCPADGSQELPPGLGETFAAVAEALSALEAALTGLPQAGGALR
jgi:hypothetical protein